MLDVVRKEAESCDCLQGALPNLVRALGRACGVGGAYDLPAKQASACAQRLQPGTASSVCESKRKQGNRKPGDVAAIQQIQCVGLLPQQSKSMLAQDVGSNTCTHKSRSEVGGLLSHRH